MTPTPNVTQASFLIGLAVDHLNKQYGGNYTAEQFNCKYIPNNQESFKAYEVFSIEAQNVSNVRFYVQKSPVSSFDPMRLESEYGVTPFELQPLSFNGQTDSIQINNPLQYVFVASIFLNQFFFKLPPGTIYAQSYVPSNVAAVENTTEYNVLVDENSILTLSDGSAILIS